jgi:hypothetical protein
MFKLYFALAVLHLKHMQQHKLLSKHLQYYQQSSGLVFILILHLLAKVRLEQLHQGFPLQLMIQFSFKVCF